MIIWLASYPKSGNTWIRSFLVSLLFTKDGGSDLSNLNLIGQFPLRSQFANLVKDLSNVHEIKKKWVSAQEIINLDKKVRFFKTHHSMVSMDNFEFTNAQNTFGVIYIVRDPRNVISSIKNHYSLKTIEEARDIMFHDDAWTGFEKNNKHVSDRKFPTLISSWGYNYNSWKQVKKNYLLIKYENLINNPISEFGKIVSYLEDKLKMNFNKDKVKKAINSNSFINLQQQEAEGKFNENMLDKNNNKIRFFDKGPKNNWKNQLDKKFSDEIEKRFNEELKELGYL